MILERYLIREIMASLLGILLVLSLIMIGQQAMLVMEKAIQGVISGSMVFEMIGLRMVSGLHMIIPFAFFLSVLLALGRLYKDSEVASMMACGSGYAPLYRGTLILASIVALLVFVMTAFLSPWTELRIEQLNIEASQQTDISKYRPGVFESSSDGRNVLYFRDYDDKAKRMKNIFMRLQKKGDSQEQLIMAETARQEIESTRSEQILHLYNGTRYQGQVGQADYSIISFKYYQIRIPDPDLEVISRSKRSLSFKSLLQSDTPLMKAELHWRLSAPISLLILAILAIPLSHSSPRQGRYAKLFTAIMLFAVYAALMGMARIWLEQGKTPMALGFWWVHGLMLALSIFMIGQRNGRGWQSNYKKLQAKIKHAAA